MIRLAIFTGLFLPTFVVLAILKSGWAPLVTALAIFVVGLVAGIALGRWSIPPDADPHFHRTH